jgi:transposase
MQMARRQFSREFKLEAVRLVKERGVSVVQASGDLDVGEGILRRWIEELTSDPGQAFPEQGQLKPEQQEIDRLWREVAKLKAERDIQKKPRPISRRSRCEVRLCRETSRDLAGAVALRGARCLALSVAPAFSSDRAVEFSSLS